MNGAGATVQLRGVEKVFDDSLRALDPITLSVQAGQFLAILGPSGCGKSTLLRLVAGLERPTSGHVQTVLVEPRPQGALSKAHVPIAFVFQDAHLLPWRTVQQNVVLPLELLGWDKFKARDAAQNSIEQVGLADAAQRYPAQLSGGMRMRVSLARALVTEPKLLLLDEPFAALDEITRQRLDDQLRELWSHGRMTVIFVTHSIVEAAFLAERAVVMSRRPGQVVLDHALDLPQQRSASLRTDPKFSREMRVLFEALESGEAG